MKNLIPKMKNLIPKIKKNSSETKKLNILFLLIACIFTLFNSIISLFSQEIIWGNSVGLFGGANINMHSPNISPSFTFPPLSKVTVSESATSFTGFLGLEGNFQLSRLFVLTGRIGYDFAGVDFDTKVGNSNYNLATSLHYLGFTPMIKVVNAIPGLESLYFTTGFNVGVPITKTYDVTQRLGNTTRNNIGTISEAQMRLSVPIGIGYIWKYSWEIAIIPEISYNVGFSDVSTGLGWNDWGFNQLKAGISITYKFSSDNKRIKDTAVTTQISAGIDNVYYIDKDSNVKAVETIRLEEAEYGEYFPLIPYIFYDINETEVPSVYINRFNDGITAGAGIEESLPDNAPSLAYRVLDIVGKRLLENPNASLTITGTIDGKYETDTQVSKGRADGVKNYLINNFQIDESRLRVESVGVPSKPSAQTVREGIVENRRVELSSNIASIFEPIFVKGDKIRFSTPDNVYFVPSAESNKPIKSWDLEIYQADRIIKQFSGEKLDDEIKWNIMMNDLYPSELPIEYKYSVHTADSTESYVGHIKLDYVSISKNKSIEQPDYVISKYSLVLFDFDSPLLTEQNKQVIDKLIIPNVKFGSNIDIYGYSDKIGNSEYNRQLSLQRANSVRDYIHTKNRNVPIKTTGLGNDTELFDNDIPVGRQLSRTVQILVITPKN